ncbi:hypothetical protein SteCoe_31482 [Stentor coeruleus]|uniref:glutathione transferase n=1 Tax=Stentor coeruleus TaxID=5963 RepID=A0A1R2B1B5_9CILI|nr:hypothetical protein SteCoe_31482 [Stentor coeruleus]
MEAKPILGYWHIRGLSEAIRYMLKHIGVDFEDRTYTQGPAPDYDRSAWTDAKDSLGMSFPNLPYFMDGDFKISETMAIAQYIALKYKPEFVGTTLQEKGLVQQLGGVVLDIKNYMSHSCYSPDFNKDRVVQDVKEELPKVVAFLGEKMFLIGDQITWPDFFLFETLEMLEAFQSGSVAEVSTKLVEYRNRIAALSGVAERIAEPRLQWNNTQAKWL